MQAVQGRLVEKILRRSKEKRVKNTNTGVRGSKCAILTQIVTEKSLLYYNGTELSIVTKTDYAGQLIQTLPAEPTDEAVAAVCMEMQKPGKRWKLRFSCAPIMSHFPGRLLRPALRFEMKDPANTAFSFFRRMPACMGFVFFGVATILTAALLF